MSNHRKKLKRSDVPDEGPDQMLTVNQAAALLDCGLETVRKLCREGRLPHYRPSDRVVRIKRSDVVEYLNGCRAAAG